MPTARPSPIAWLAACTALCEPLFAASGTPLRPNEPAPRPLFQPAGPSVRALKPVAVERSDRLVIEGSDFGTRMGTVLVSGVPAVVSAWSQTRITLYPRDATPLGTQELVVQAEAGSSAPQPLTILPRGDPDGAGRATWRFRADDLAIESRPVTGADGTIYAASVGGQLYALAHDGGIRWVFLATPPHCQRPLALGADGTIYMAALFTLIAVGPDGQEKWRVVDPDYDPIEVGPGVGPDGNVYALTADNGNGGFGAFSVDPAGVVRWSRAGFHTAGGARPCAGEELGFDEPGKVCMPTPVGEGLCTFDLESGELLARRAGVRAETGACQAAGLVARCGQEPPRAGFVEGRWGSEGALMWRLELPFENGGHVRPKPGMRFAADASMLYVGTAHDERLADPYCYLYAIATGVRASVPEPERAPEPPVELGLQVATSGTN